MASYYGSEYDALLNDQIKLNYTWVTVSGGRTVHIQTPNSKTLCGADNCSTGTRRKGYVTAVKNAPNCKRCLRLALKAQESK